MTKRTSQIHISTLTFPSGNTFSLPIPASPNSSTELKFAIGSSTDTGLHWHEQHTEFFEVLQGVGKLTLENSNGVLETYYVSKSSGTVTIPRYKRHCLGRGDEGSSSSSSHGIPGLRVQGDSQPDTEEWKDVLLVREWSDPKDGQKEVFFRNLAGIVFDSPSGPWKSQVHKMLGNWWMEWQLWVVFGSLDNYPAIFGGKWKSIEFVAVHILCMVLRFLGTAVGLRGEYDEYTPSEFRGGNMNKVNKNM